jgi:shikimate kinase
VSRVCAAVNIILIGFRGSGKSTVGMKLAGLLGLGFVDTDEEIQRTCGKTISQIFSDEGEERFRELERTEVLKACKGRKSVVAVGGGAVQNPELARAVRRAGIVILLNAPAEVLHERISGDSKSSSRRPALTEAGGLDEVRNLLARRRPAYERTAHIEIDTSGLKTSEVAEEIRERLRGPDFAGIFSKIIA